MRNGLVIIAVLFLFYSCHLETKRLEHFQVHGIDVSHYQSTINWDLVADQDISFSFVKASEGESLKDSLFSYNWSEIKRVGIRRGAYHFFRPTISAYRQARNFTDAVHLDTGDLPPVLDIEVLDGVSQPLLHKRLKTWLDLVEKHYKVRPIIYTNLNFYNKHIATHFDSYPIWIARYNYKAPTLGDGTQWRFWQYGNRGQLAGIEGDVDFNVFEGTYEELSEMCIGESTALSGF